MNCRSPEQLDAWLLDIEDRLRAMEHIPLFASCDSDELRSLAESAYLLAFQDVGRKLIESGTLSSVSPQN